MEVAKPKMIARNIFMRRKTLAEAPDVQQPFWGAHVSGVLVAAFCGDELFSLLSLNPSRKQSQSSRSQDAIASTLQACAPQNRRD
jgi:hypothetical protein